MKDLVRQGDLLFVPIGVIPTGCWRQNTSILALGEVTGHKHQILESDYLDGKAEVYEVDGQKFLRVGDRISIVHEEHGTVELEPGSYQVNIAREYDYSRNHARYVAD